MFTMLNAAQLVATGGDRVPDSFIHNPDFGYFPFMDTLYQIAQGIQGAALVILVVLIVVAAVSWVAGRATSSQTMQRVSVGALITCGVGAMLVGASWAFVRWAGNQDVLSSTAQEITTLVSMYL